MVMLTFWQCSKSSYRTAN